MSNNTSKNAPAGFGMIILTGGSDSAIETESHYLFVTPMMPEYDLPARMFQRREKQGEPWAESGMSADSNPDRLAKDIEIDPDGNIVKFTREVRRMLHSRVISASDRGSGVYLVPLSNDDIDSLVSITFPELPESVIGKAMEVLA